MTSSFLKITKLSSVFTFYYRSLCFLFFFFPKNNRGFLFSPLLFAPVGYFYTKRHAFIYFNHFQNSSQALTRRFGSFWRSFFFNHESRLILNGVGYRVVEESRKGFLRNGSKLRFQFGWSHNLFFFYHSSLHFVQIVNPQELAVFNAHPDFKKQFVNVICHFKRPDPYKSKGILVSDFKNLASHIHTQKLGKALLLFIYMKKKQLSRIVSLFSRVFSDRQFIFFCVSALKDFFLLIDVCCYVHRQGQRILFIHPSTDFERLFFLFRPLLNKHLFSSRWKNGYLTNSQSSNFNMEELGLVVFLSANVDSAIQKEFFSLNIPCGGFTFKQFKEVSFPVNYYSKNLVIDFLFLLIILSSISAYATK